MRCVLSRGDIIWKDNYLSFECLSAKILIRMSMGNVLNIITIWITFHNMLGSASSLTRGQIGINRIGKKTVIQLPLVRFRNILCFGYDDAPTKLNGKKLNSL